MLLADGTRLDYDILIIATGVTPRPDQTPGMIGDQWRRSIHEFYSYEGSIALAAALAEWPGGRLVINIVDMPIKCPVAPLEFAFLADAYFADRGMREKVDMTYVTPLPGAFTKPIASMAFGDTLASKHIAVEPDFMLMEIDPDGRMLRSYDDREVPFDLLVTIPLNMGADFVHRSGMGNELNLVPVDRFTQQAKSHDNVFALGDANDIPASKAGSVAHFEIETFVKNLVQYLADRPMTHRFDGHAKLLHRDRRRQGDAHRLQLRHRTASREVPAARARPYEPAETHACQSSRQAGIQMDLLECPDARSSVAVTESHVYDRQEDRSPHDPLTRPLEGITSCQLPRSTATVSWWTTRAS